MVTFVVIYLGSLECLLAVTVCCLFGVRFVCSCVEICVVCLVLLTLIVLVWYSYL